MTLPNYRRTRFACYFSYLSMASVFVLPAMLFTTFRNMYGISFTLLGTLVVVNFCTQMLIDLIFTFFSRHFNIALTVRIMPVMTCFGLLLYALIPTLFPQYAYWGLVIGTVIFSVAAGLSEVLLSPIISAIPSDHPEKDMSLLHSLYGWGVVSVVLLSSVYFLLFGTENWVYLAAFYAVLPLIPCWLFCTSPIPPLTLSQAEQKQKTPGRAKRLFLCALCIFLGSSAENMMTNWVSGYMEIALHVPKETGDILGLAIFAFLLATTRVVYAKFSPSIIKVLLWGMVGAAGCYLVAGLSPDVILAFAACILTGIFTSMLWPGTLILMEEKIAAPGVAAYALMAAAGDCGAAIAPQLLGIIADNVAVSEFALSASQTLGMTPDEIGLKTGMLIVSIFPIIGFMLVLYMKRYFRKSESISK